MRVDFTEMAIITGQKELNDLMAEQKRQRSCNHSYQMSIHDLQIFVCTKCDDMVEVDAHKNDNRQKRSKNVISRNNRTVHR